MTTNPGWPYLPSSHVFVVILVRSKEEDVQCRYKKENQLCAISPFILLLVLVQTCKVYLSVTSSIMIGIEDASKNCDVVMHMLETRQNHVYVCTTIIINAHHQHQCQCGICMVVVMMKFAICIWGHTWCFQYIQKVLNDTGRKKEEQFNPKCNNHCHWQYRYNGYYYYDFAYAYAYAYAYAEGAKVKKGKRTTSGIPQMVATIHAHAKINHRAWRDKGSKKWSHLKQQPLALAQVM